MDNVIKFIERIEYFTQIADSIDEDNDSLSVKGVKNRDILSQFIILLKEAKATGFSHDQVTILDEDHNGQNISLLQERIEDDEPIKEWTINISKKPLVDALTPENKEYRTILFITQEGFSRFTNQISKKPFSSVLRPFPESGCLKIFARSLKTCFGGPCIWVQGLQTFTTIPSEWPYASLLPSEENVKKQVHVVPSESINIDPMHYSLSWGDIAGESAAPFRTISALMLASCLVNVFYGIEKVVLRGIKHQELPLLCDDDNAPEKEFLSLLHEAVEWVYAERSETRLSLLGTRLTIDLPSNASFIAGLKTHLKRALQQSKEEYEFVILDRKDEYEKEKRDLLKDIRNQAELYSKKVWELQKGLLRDTLAGFVFLVLMGIRVGSNLDSEEYTHFVLIFKALGIYFTISYVLQLVISIADIRISRIELDCWVDETRNYLEKKTIERQIKGQLYNRNVSFRATALVIGLIYAGIVYLSWNIGWFFG